VRERRHARQPHDSPLGIMSTQRLLSGQLRTRATGENDSRGVSPIAKAIV
jgi:hypothetical protein